MGRQKKRERPRRQIAILVGCSLGLVLILLVIYMVNPSIRQQSPAATPPKPPIPCANTDASFCTAMRRLVAGASGDDFSILLTAQQSEAVNCSQNEQDTHCQNQTGQILTLYSVAENSTLVTLTHNEYIVFFRELVTKYGEPRYESYDCISSTICVIKLAGTNLKLSLPLTNGVSGWQLTTPEVQTTT